MLLIVAALTAFVAAVIQRITGLGFMLVLIGPFVLIYGGIEGVTVGVLLALVAAAIAVPLVWREVDWRRTAWLVWPGLVAAPAGLLLVRLLPEPALLLVIGALAVFALVAGRIPQLARALTGRSGAVAAGAAAGFMNVASGLAGPPLAAHAVGDGWPQRSFSASVQVIFAAFGVITVALRGLPAEPPTELALLAAATAVGIVAGSLLARAVPPGIARRAMLVIAWGGAVLVIVRGAAALSS